MSFFPNTLRQALSGIRFRDVKMVFRQPALFIVLSGFVLLYLVRDGFYSYAWYISISIVLLLRFFGRRTPSVRAVPDDMYFAFVLLVFYKIISLTWSSDRSMTLFDASRYGAALLVFVTVYEKTSERILFVLFKVILGYIFLALPVWAIVSGVALPTIPAGSMNLFIPQAGHSHVVDVLVPGVIGAVAYWSLAGATPALVLSFVYFVGIVLSMSYGAMVFAFVGGAIAASIRLRTMSFRQMKKNRQFLLIAYGCALCLAFVFLAAGFSREIPTATTRLDYWTRGHAAFLEKPITGFGAGTFHLVSMRYKTMPGSHASFAHNILIDEAAGGGAVGLVLFLFLFVVIVRRAAGVFGLSSDPVRKSLFLMAAASFLYSMVEFNLHYQSVWLLFWITLSLSLISPGPPSRKSDLFSSLIAGALVFMWATETSYLLGRALNLRSLPQWIHAYRLNGDDALKDALAWDTKTQEALLFFHKENPDMLYTFASARKQSCDDETTRTLYEKALAHDPTSVDKLVARLRFEEPCLSADKLNELFVNYFPKIRTLGMSKGFDPQTLRLPPGADYLASALFEEESYIRHDILLYRTGLEAYDSGDPVTALAYWSAAAALLPDLSYYHVEAASLYANIFGDTGAAHRILIKCLDYPSASSHCQSQLSGQLPPPGFYRREIL